MVDGAVAANPARLSRPSALSWVKGYLPEGHGLPNHEWSVRHRAVILFVFAHAVGLAIFGLARGWPLPYALGEGAFIGALGGVAMLPALSRKMRSGVAALACATSSAVLVQFSGGTIEAHFHFFVVVALISLYQDWVPFLLAISFVALDHGALGTVLPGWVYNHPDALAHPWKWAAIHATMVLAECTALVVVWRTNEEARAETDRVLRSAGEGLFGVDGSCCITFANPAALRMAGQPEGQLLGRPLYALVLGEDGRPAFPPDILRTSPGTFTAEAFLARPGGRPMPIEVLCSPFEGRAHAEGAVVAIRDLTERRRNEEVRAQAVVQQQELHKLREVNSFKTRFMNMAAHELNTPLTPIKIQLHLLKKRASGEPDRHSVTLLDRNFQRLSGLVKDLLDSTRLQGDHLPVRLEHLDLAPLLRELGDSFRPAAEAAGVALRLEVADRLPARADAPRIAQAVSNLLSNAVKFTPAKGTVVLAARPERGGTRIEVRDTGIGLDPQQAKRLFQPFEQVHESQTAEHAGSGLGLYITRGIIELHGGQVWVESAGSGKGSRFSIQLPAQVAAWTAAYPHAAP
ncbi:MAG: PAS domain-containing sensor histidine kinase [Halobacteriales archaeon]|nr:PAS domain-containing sensor histidine kinase [Halobacteriales archaeon]